MTNSRSFFSAVFALLLLFSASAQLFGHGYVMSPASRSYQGYLDKSTIGYSAALALYGTIINEPQSLETLKGFPAQGPPDGRIASANGALGGDYTLDMQTATRWKKTNINTGTNAFTWKYTAYHATTKWHYYITRQGWNPNQPLARQDLELIGEIAHNGAAPQDNAPHQVNIPGNRSGYHIILAVWDIDNTVNAFYNVIDVNVQSSTGVTAPATPTGLATVNVTSTTAKISWTPQTDATAFNVFRNGVAIQNASASEFNDAGLNPATSYTYEVQAINAAGLTSPKSVPLTLTTSGQNTIEQPTAPANLHAMGTTQNSISLMWMASTHSQGISKYEIFENGIKVVETTTTHYMRTGLTAGTQYSYTVRAVAQNAAISASSNTLTISTNQAANQQPTAPANLHAMGTTQNSTSLMWTAATHPLGINKYEIFENSIKIAETTTTHYMRTGLTAGTQYSYTVRAVAQNNAVSNPSNTLIITTQANNNPSYCGEQQYNPANAYPTALTKVFYDCSIWQNKWYANPNEVPGVNMVWEELSVCTEAPSCQTSGPVLYCGARLYSQTQTYATAGTQVFYNCKIWKNKWYANPGEAPGSNMVWEELSSCNEGPGCSGAANNSGHHTMISLIVSNNQINLAPENIRENINELHVFNTYGVRVLHAPHYAKQGVDISALTPGVYIVKIIYKDGRVVTKKISKAL